MRAGEGPLAAVQAADVLHQRRPVGELLAAQVAAVLPLARVRDLVRLSVDHVIQWSDDVTSVPMQIDCKPPHLQIRPGLECPAAVLAGERPVRRVDDGRVPRQQRLGAEGATALCAGERAGRALRGRGDLRLEEL